MVGARRLLALVALAVMSGVARAQVPSDLAAERAALGEWLAKSPVSPLAAIASLPVDAAGTALPIGNARLRLVERRGAVWLEGDGPARTLPRERPSSIANHRVVVNGEPGRFRATVYGTTRAAAAPAYFEYDPRLVFIVTLAPPAAPRMERVLLADGTEASGADAGTVQPALAGGARLRVLRLPDPSPDEPTLQVYFRDATNGSGSYPAGRFVTLDPLPGGRWRLDFNRARNPFCAYNPAYPCPAPWRGNTLAMPIRGGERYESH